MKYKSYSYQVKYKSYPKSKYNTYTITESMVVIPKIGMPVVAAFPYLIRYDISTLVFTVCYFAVNDRKYTVFHYLILVVKINIRIASYS